MGFIITELYVRRSEVRRSGCPKTKRILGRSGFSFRCHRATNERKKERKKHIEKHQQYQYQYKWRYVCMKMHENVIRKLKSIMGSAQSKSISTHHCNKIDIHLKCMIHCYNADVMQCMMFLNSFKQKPTQKFCKTLINFENPQKIFKNPKT